MAKAKKKSPARPPGTKGLGSPAPALAPKVLEEAAQGWLQSFGTNPSSARPGPTATEERLAEALIQTLQQFRSEIAELRSRLDRIETR